MVENVAGTCRELFLANYATLGTVFEGFAFFRVIEYLRLLKVRFFATFDTRDFFYLRLFLPANFSSLIEIILATFDFSRNICQNRHEIKKNRSMIRDIFDI